MFKLKQLPAVIAIGLGAAVTIPAHAGLLDDLAGAKYNPLAAKSTTQNKGSFSKPFAEPFVYDRTGGNKPGDLKRTETAEKCLESLPGSNGKKRCKPAAGTISLLPSGEFLYFNALEGT